ncbi:MAG: aminotransferase class V-fold PLP-dependent enzyme [Nitrospirales bacterium]|nr:aminotransferase class V-fold PLP-dependent enzyme [Nitrospirales bacterium]
MILLNPGPVNVSDRVRQVLLEPDVCHRESECAELIGHIRTKLLQAFVPGAEDDYTAIVLTGSGTAAVEASVLSSVPLAKRILVINNGVYGQRLSAIAGTHRLGVPELKFEWGTCPDPEKVKLALQQHPEVATVAMVHHETTVGLINPVEEIAKIVDDAGRIFVVDAVSGLGGDPLDIAGTHMYVVAGTAGKCIQGFPGVSFALVRKGFMDRALKYPKRSCYLNLANYYEAQEKGSIPFTPAIQLYRAFHEALDELLEEGVAKRIERYGRMAHLLRQRMGGLGINAVLAPERQSNSLTAWYLPEHVPYQALHDALKAKGYVIYAGQGHLESKIFRVANMGALTEHDFEGFVSALEAILPKVIAR